jgi:hypothetical protein
MVSLAILIAPGLILFMIPVLALFGTLWLSHWAFFRSRLALCGSPMPMDEPDDDLAIPKYRTFGSLRQ